MHKLCPASNTLLRPTSVEMKDMPNGTHMKHKPRLWRSILQDAHSPSTPPQHKPRVSQRGLGGRLVRGKTVMEEWSRSFKDPMQDLQRDPWAEAL